MPDFTFDPIKHQYKVNGIVYPSVSQVLPYNYKGNNTEAMLMGTYVHEMCRLYLLNALDEESLDPALVPYLDAFKKFLNDSKGMGIEGVIDIKSGSPHPCVELQVPAYIELVNHGIYMDGGTLDYTESKLLLETPMHHPVHVYCGTPDIVIGDIPVKEGFALYLKSNGKYKLDQISNNRRNFEMFLCFLNTKKWMISKGIDKE